MVGGPDGVQRTHEHGGVVWLYVYIYVHVGHYLYATVLILNTLFVSFQIVFVIDVLTLQ